MVQKVAGSTQVRTQALPDWKTLCKHSSKCVLICNQGRIRQKKERDALHLSYAMPKLQ